MDAVDTTFDLEATILGPHCAALDDGDVRRLFGRSALTEQRLDRLRRWPRILVRRGDAIMGAATCERAHSEFLVPDVGLAENAETVNDVINALLDAIESACLAGGCRRIVLSPPRAGLALLERRGYQTVRASCAGSWMEKDIA
jgi:hypothetical protein